MMRVRALAVVLFASVALAQTPPGAVHPEVWPVVAPRAEGRGASADAVEALLAKMTLEEKVAQTIQPSVGAITPADVKAYHFGSVLNGGGGFPGDIRKVTAKDWRDLSQRLHAAAMDTSGGKQAIPVLWGSDAVHGHSNVVGATLFPHNIGLGATNHPALIKRIGEVTAVEMAATGIDWDFSPVVAVARDDGWGRTYESYAEDPEIVAKMAAAMVEGLQRGRTRVLATAKHFLGDGGTVFGKDQGDTQASETELRDIHARGYVAALQAGAQTVMVSQSSWHGREMHGNKDLLTNVLKERMGFDGFIVGDWNGHGQVPGCSNEKCATSFNAGVDMFMVPDDWKALYENTLAQVKSGEIPRARLDDAVRRILRVKMRAGLFDKPKAAPPLAAIGSRAHRDVARQAVRESLVLLKNNGGVLPLKTSSRVLVAGDANDIAKQAGGWTISWQGDGNTNKDFPGATSIWEGIRAKASKATFSADGSFDGKPDVAIVVFGENPYAEWFGDRKTIVYEDDKALAILRKLEDAGVPVVSVFLSGRPLWVNPFLNASDAFVAAWLPGTEGDGVADVLFGKSEFQGKLSFSWPKVATQVVLNRGDSGYDPLFPVGFGLTSKDRSELPQLPVDTAGIDRGFVFFAAGPVAPWKLSIDKGLARREEPAGRRVITWSGKEKGEVSLRSDQPVALLQGKALAIDVLMEAMPTASVTVTLGSATVDATPILRALPLAEWHTIRIPVRCFGDVTQADRVAIGTEGAMTLRFADIELVMATDLACPEPRQVMSAVADWQLAHPSKHPANEWQQAPFWIGLHALPRYRDAIRRNGEASAWKLGPNLFLADDHAIAQSYFLLYDVERDRRMIDPALATFDRMLRNPFDESLEFNWEKTRREWLWCDALFMSPPALAMAAKATGDRRYLDLMNRLWWKTTDYLYDKNAHLYYRDSRFFGSNTFWSRGNGWVLAGLARVLQFMPADYPERPRYVTLFREMAQKIAALQPADGYWRTNLLDPNSRPAPETSGTAFFTYALAWGVNEGLLDRSTYEPVVRKGWAALARAVHPDGMLGYVQRIGDQPGDVTADSTEIYGAGALLLAGSEVTRLAR